MDSEQPGMGGAVLNLPPTAASATATAGVSCAMGKDVIHGILRKIAAGALQKTALFLTHLLTRKRRIKK